MPVKLLSSPNSNTDKSGKSRLSLNIFYFATGDTRKDSGLEIEFLLDTGASCSTINYRTFWEICQLQHSITIQKSTKVTTTYSGQTVPMIGHATITFSYDPDGQFIIPLAVWITEMRTQYILAWTLAKNWFLQFILICLGLNLRILQSQFVMAVFTKTIPILIYHKSWQLEPLYDIYWC